MNVEVFLSKAKADLENASIGTARLDSLVLLEDETAKDRSWLLAHPEAPLQGQALQRLEEKIARRVKHEPLAYIRGFSEFYGRRFIVNKNVLEPRPESETMIELLKQLVAGHKSRVASRLSVLDVGTGSGALAISTKLEIPTAEVIATDIDPKCLRVARQNAKTLGAKVKFLQGNLLEPLLGTKDWGLGNVALLCNLPYVPRNWQINQEAAMEPRLAIDGGSDGLDIYRRLFVQLSKANAKPKFILTESLPPQHRGLAAIARQSGYKLQQTEDFIQLFKKEKYI